jgi:hypothetical protein
MKNGLFTYGCSHTYGYGLPDTKQEVKVPLETNFNKETFQNFGSTKNWGQYIANKWDLEYYNFGVSGANNREIFHWTNECVKHNMIQKTDKVIFFWNNFGSRWSIFKDPSDRFENRLLENQYPQGLPAIRMFLHDPKKTYDRWFEVYHSSSEAEVANWHYIHYTNLLIEKIGITPINFFTEPPWVYPNKEFRYESVTKNYFRDQLKYACPILFLDKNIPFLDYASDNSHAGMSQHKKWAKQMLQWLDEQGYES